MAEEGPESPAADADGDELSDRQEAAAGTLPGTADTDGDGVSDGEELQSGRLGQVTSPTDPDCDDDGMNDLAEGIAGTDPWAADSFFQCLEISGEEFPMVGRILRWGAATGRAYSVYASSNLPAFGPVTSGMAATPPENVWTDSVDRPLPVFYRLGVTRP